MNLDRPRTEPCHDIEVAILGPTEVRGVASGFSRASALELVAYLAMHPGGASNDAWARVGECSHLASRFDPKAVSMSGRMQLSDARLSHANCGGRAVLFEHSVTLSLRVAVSVRTVL